MIKTLVLMLVSLGILSAATPEQVERYLFISGSEDQLIAFEKSIDDMGKVFASKGGSGAPLMEDSQMIPIRFREFIQKHLSEDEMDEVLANYGHDVMRKIVRAEVLMEESETVEAYRQFLLQIKDSPLSSNRTETVRKVIKHIYDEKELATFFKKMIVPMIKKMSAASGKSMEDKAIDKIIKSFIKRMQDSNYNTMLFMTRDFSDDELQELEDVSGNSATSHETQAIFGGITYAMEEAMNNMTNQFVVMIKKSKHSKIQPSAESNGTQSSPTRSSAQERAPAR